MQSDQSIQAILGKHKATNKKVSTHNLNLFDGVYQKKCLTNIVHCTSFILGDP